MEMYEVVARNCNTCPKIKYSRKNLTKATAKFVALNLARAFRQVDILNQDTGEVMLSTYVSDEFFKKEMSEVEAIAMVEVHF